MQRDQLISIAEAVLLVEQRLGRKISRGKLTSILEEANIPTQESVLDKRKRLLRQSALEEWIQQAEAELQNGTPEE